MNFVSRTSIPIYRATELRALEVQAAMQSPMPSLMERAGLAAAQIARDMVADGGRGILIFAGPGNNGGDALVVARHLRSWWFRVDVVFAGDAVKLPIDARDALAAWRGCGGSLLDRMPPDRRWDLVIDGLFGTGLKRDLTGRYAALVAAINNARTTVLALDVPSGLDADTGRELGCAVRADHTATFIALKPGLLTLDGPDHCGEIHLCTLDLDADIIGPTAGAIIGSNIMLSVLPRRRANTHKGSYGSVGIIGGAPGMAGAALLAGRAALNLGSGRVYVGLLGNDSPGYDPGQPELMLRTAHEILRLDHLDCLAIGPGLGQQPDAWQTLYAALRQEIPLVLDADALNLTAASKELRALVAARNAVTLLTPHPAEAARLLECGTPAIQNDRVSAACEIAARFKSSVVLKGAGSICALSDGKWFINTTGNPGMASAGMGDALTGILAALLAQGADAGQALLAGVHLHGTAADMLAIEVEGQVGITASGVICAAPTVFNRARSRR